MERGTTNGIISVVGSAALGVALLTSKKSASANSEKLKNNPESDPPTIVTPTQEDPLDPEQQTRTHLTLITQILPLDNADPNSEQTQNQLKENCDFTNDGECVQLAASLWANLSLENTNGDIEVDFYNNFDTYLALGETPHGVVATALSIQTQENENGNQVPTKAYFLTLNQNDQYDIKEVYLPEGNSVDIAVVSTPDGASNLVPLYIDNSTEQSQAYTITGVDANGNPILGAVHVDSEISWTQIVKLDTPPVIFEPENGGVPTESNLVMASLSSSRQSGLEPTPVPGGIAAVAEAPANTETETEIEIETTWTVNITSVNNNIRERPTTNSTAVGVTSQNAVETGFVLFDNEFEDAFNMTTEQALSLEHNGIIIIPEDDIEHYYIHDPETNTFIQVEAARGSDNTLWVETQEGWVHTSATGGFTITSEEVEVVVNDSDENEEASEETDTTQPTSPETNGESLTIPTSQLVLNFPQNHPRHIPLGKNIQSSQTPYAASMIDLTAPYYRELGFNTQGFHSGILLPNEDGHLFSVDDQGYYFVTIGFPEQGQDTNESILITSTQRIYIGSSSPGDKLSINGGHWDLDQIQQVFTALESQNLYLQASFLAIENQLPVYNLSQPGGINTSTISGTAAYGLIIGSEEFTISHLGRAFWN